VVSGYPTVVCHCLVLRDGDRAALIDAGIGLHDARDPVGRLGQDLIDMAGFRFNEGDTAVRRLESLGIDPASVRDIVLTHADPDHAGGLADFPHARVHLSDEELRGIESGRPRYAPALFDHGPDWVAVGDENATNWFGLPARRLSLAVSGGVFLVSLPGHTSGHCGVAVERPGGWLLHVGDAYYLRAELSQPDHPVGELAAARADDDNARLRSLDHLRRIAAEDGNEVEMFSYHDLAELPAECVDWE